MLRSASGSPRTDARAGVVAAHAYLVAFGRLRLRRRLRITRLEIHVATRKRLHRTGCGLDGQADSETRRIEYAMSVHPAIRDLRDNLCVGLCLIRTNRDAEQLSQAANEPQNASAARFRNRLAASAFIGRRLSFRERCGSGEEGGHGERPDDRISG